MPGVKNVGGPLLERNAQISPPSEVKTEKEAQYVDRGNAGIAGAAHCR